MTTADETLNKLAGRHELLTAELAIGRGFDEGRKGFICRVAVNDSRAACSSLWP
jgi:hypothetical protein